MNDPANDLPINSSSNHYFFQEFIHSFTMSLVRILATVSFLLWFFNLCAVTSAQDKLDFQLENDMRHFYQRDGRNGDARARNLVSGHTEMKSEKK
jgi:hypothetical protein